MSFFRKIYEDFKVVRARQHELALGENILLLEKAARRAERDAATIACQAERIGDLESLIYRQGDRIVQLELDLADALGKIAA